MSAVQPSLEPEPSPDESQGVFNDWLGLLSGPIADIFGPPPVFKIKRLLRLLGFVLFISSSLVGLSFLPEIKSITWTEVLGGIGGLIGNKAIRYGLLTGGASGVVYSLLFAKVCRIKIDVQDSFYTILFIIAPWVPLCVFVWSLIKTHFWPFGTLGLTIWSLFVLVAVSSNFAKAVSIVVPNCHWVKIWISITLALSVAAFLYLA